MILVCVNESLWLETVLIKTTFAEEKSASMWVSLSSYSQLSQIVSTKKPDWRSRDATI